MTPARRSSLCRFDGVRSTRTGPTGRRTREGERLSQGPRRPDPAGGPADAPTDARVIERSWDDPHAFAEIFDRHHEGIYRFVWTRAGGDRADDLAAEVFRIAFEKRRDYDLDYRSAKPWLFGIASRLSKQTHRETARRDHARERLTSRERPPPARGPQEHLERRPSSGSPAAEAVERLPERDREPLLLYAWGDLTYEEIAESLDIPVGTVRSRIHRARQRVREELEETGSETAPETTPEAAARHREERDG